MFINPNLIFINESENVDETKLWCSLCEFLLKSKNDLKCQKDFGCCEECWLSFGEMRQKEWKDGWRPDSKTLDRYKAKRKILNIDVKKLIGIENES